MYHSWGFFVCFLFFHLCKVSMFLSKHCSLNRTVFSNYQLIIWSHFFSRGGIQEIVLRTRQRKYCIFLRNSYQDKGDILISSGNYIIEGCWKLTFCPCLWGDKHFLSREIPIFLGLLRETFKDRLRIILKETVLEELVGFLPNYYLPKILSPFVQLRIWDNIKAKAWGVKEEEIYDKIIFVLCQPELQPGNGQMPPYNVRRLSWKYYTENKVLPNAGFILSLNSSLSLTVTAVESQFWKVKTLVVGEWFVLFT